MKEAMIAGMPLITEELKYYNIFSMYELNCNFDNKYIEPIDSRMKEFRDTFILIYDFQEFKKELYII